MSFLHPLILLAGIGLAIPIIIHLYNLRKFKKIYFSDISLVENIVTKSKQHATIEKWALLISRLLIMASLIWAFAEPFLQKDHQQTSAAAPSIIHIDNSISMTYTAGQQSNLDLAKSQLIQFLKAQHPNATFYITTNHQTQLDQLLDRDAAIEHIQHIELTQHIFDVQDVINALSRNITAHNLTENQLFIVSDWAKHEKDSIQQNSAQGFKKIYAIQANNSAIENIAIDTAYITSPYLVANQPNELIVKLKQYGTNENNTEQISVYNGNQLLTSGTVKFENTDTAILQLNLQVTEAEWYNIKITKQPDALTADDTFYLSAQASPQRSALVIGRKMNPNLQAAFSSIPNFNYQLSSSITNWEQYSLIILQELDFISAEEISKLQTALQMGKNVWIIPPPNNTKSLENISTVLGKVTLANWDTTTQLVNKIQINHPVFKNVFSKIDEQTQYPTINGRYKKANLQQLNEIPIISFRDGQPLLSQYTDQAFKGNLYIMYTPLDARKNHLLSTNYFAPMVMRMAEANAEQGIYTYELGSTTPIQLIQEQTNGVWHIKNDNLDIIPEQRPYLQYQLIFTQKQILQAGIYDLVQEHIVKRIGLNWNRTESNLAPYNADEIAELIQEEVIFTNYDALQTINVQNDDAEFPLWKIGIIIAILAVITETFLLRKP